MELPQLIDILVETAWENNMKIKEFISKIFESRSGVSSKRLCGVIGWLICIFICLYCTMNAVAAPAIVEYLFICSSGLLGIDSVTGIWKK